MCAAFGMVLSSARDSDDNHMSETVLQVPLPMCINDPVVLKTGKAACHRGVIMKMLHAPLC